MNKLTDSQIKFIDWLIIYIERNWHPNTAYWYASGDGGNYKTTWVGYLKRYKEGKLDNGTHRYGHYVLPATKKLLNLILTEHLVYTEDIETKECSEERVYHKFKKL